MSHMHKIIITPHISIVIPSNCNGSKFNKIAIIILITIIIKQRRHIIIIIGFLISSRWIENTITIITTKNLNIIDKLHIERMVLSNLFITMTSSNRMIVIISYVIVLSIKGQGHSIKHIIISCKRIFKHIILELGAYLIIVGRNMNSINSIAIIIF